MSKREWLPPANPPELDWARLAAFIDGEGCISICKREQKHCELKIAVDNTDPRLIVWLKDTFKTGNISTRSWKNEGESTSYKHSRPSYKWEIVARVAQWVLEGCFPFFVIKKDQARIALELRNTIKDYSRRNRIPVDVMDLRMQLKADLSAEKQRIVPMEEIKNVP